jgi:hypothetical protein
MTEHLSLAQHLELRTCYVDPSGNHPVHILIIIFSIILKFRMSVVVLQIQQIKFIGMKLRQNAPENADGFLRTDGSSSPKVSYGQRVLVSVAHGSAGWGEG